MRASKGVRVRQNARMRADRCEITPQPGLFGEFFSATDGAALTLSFDFSQLWDHAHDGGARNRWIAARMSLTMVPVTAASASWKVMARA